jgi:hypothetical protein
VQILHDEHVLLFHDKYPKGLVHELVVPREEGLWDLSCLRPRHQLLVNHMQHVAEGWVSSLPDEDTQVRHTTTPHGQSAFVMFTCLGVTS